MGRTVVSDDLFHPLTFYLAEAQCSIERLIETFRVDNPSRENLGDHLLLIDCADKDYWIQTLGKCGYSLEISHPLCCRGNPLEQVRELAEENPVHVLFVCFIQSFEMRSKVKIALLQILLAYKV